MNKRMIIITKVIMILWMIVMIKIIEISDCDSYNRYQLIIDNHSYNSSNFNKSLKLTTTVDNQ